ncbi:ankyrin [Lophiostoma macrostomum CBS 122681]|uniref:Ankyrin n=1 Tax=Lophiostoma macrostomum CBS 122681 TaxID=1314788 RepID=A0A6A6T1I9_9PLEO|nr:ankyrin [Lophiostoma macrostomum CBS 122681]
MAEDPNAKYAIHEACREGQTSRAEALLSANPRLATLRDPDDRLPIHWSVSYNHLPITTLLMQSPTFDPDASDASGWTPLMMSCSRREADGDATVTLLLSKSSSVNAKNVAGQTALHFAASKAALDIARQLLAAGASARVKDRRGQVPLHRAAAVGSVPMLRLLLGPGKSAVNGADVDGMTALHHAVSEGHGDAALVLLVAGAEWEKVDGEGKTALDYCPDAKTRRFIVQSAEREGIDLE